MQSTSEPIAAHTARKQRPFPRLISPAGKDRINRLAQLLTIASIVMAPLLMGGVHFHTALALGGAATLAGWAVFMTHRFHRPRLLNIHFGLAGLALLVALCFTTLQLLPLPLPLLETLAPTNAEVIRAAYTSLGETPRWAPLSLAPGATAMALWVLLGALGIYGTAYYAWATKARFEWALHTIVFGGLIFLAATIVQSALFHDSILGIYTPTFMPNTPLVSPLLNTNHAAAWFGAVAFVALGFGFAGRNLSRRATYLLFYAALSVAMLLCLSRGAILAWALAHLVFLYVIAAPTLNRSRLTSTLLVILMLGTVTAAFYIANDKLDETFTHLREAIARSPEHLEGPNFANTGLDEEADLIATATVNRNTQPKSFEKVIIYHDLKSMFMAFPVLGVGRGAFADPYAAYATHGHQGTFRHAENEALETLIEFGLPATLLIALLLLLFFLRALALTQWREADRPLVASIATALAFLALQNTFDFNLRYPASAFLAAALLGLMAGRTYRYRRADQPSATQGTAASWRQWIRRAFPLTAIALTLIATAVASITLPQAYRATTDAPLIAAREEVELFDQEPPTDLDDFLAALTNALLERPANAYLRFLVGVAYLRLEIPNIEAANRWLNEAKRLNPTDYRTRLLLGRIQAAQSNATAAARSFSIAAGLDRGRSHTVANSAAKLLPSVELLELSLSQDPEDWSALGQALIAQRRFAEAIDIAHRLQQRFPEQHQGIEMEIDALVALGIPEAAHAPLENLVDTFGERPQVHQKKAQIAIAQGQIEKARNALLVGLELHPKEPLLLFAHTELLIYRGQPLFPDSAMWQSITADALETLRPVALAHKPSRFRYHYLKGEFQLRLDAPKAALREFERSHALNPKALGPLRKAFQTALTIERFDRAQIHLDTLATLVGTEEIVRLRKTLEERQAASAARSPIAP